MPVPNKDLKNQKKKNNKNQEQKLKRERKVRVNLTKSKRHTKALPQLTAVEGEDPEKRP